VINQVNRKKYVIQMLAISSLEGIEPDEVDQLLLEAYIEGRVSLDQLLAHASQFATSAAYDEWKSTQVHILFQPQHANSPTIQVMTEMRASMKRKYQKNIPNANFS
jgi:hypothetical protein